jgi:hypothetical protein
MKTKDRIMIFATALILVGFPAYLTREVFNYFLVEPLPATVFVVSLVISLSVMLTLIALVAAFILVCVAFGKIK